MSLYPVIHRVIKIARLASCHMSPDFINVEQLCRRQGSVLGQSGPNMSKPYQCRVMRLKMTKLGERSCSFALPLAGLRGTLFGKLFQELSFGLKVWQIPLPKDKTSTAGIGSYDKLV